MTRVPSLPLALLAGEQLRRQAPIVAWHSAPGGTVARFDQIVRAWRAQVPRGPVARVAVNTA